MRTRSSSIAILLICALALGAASAAPPARKAGALAENKCLGCHAPYDKIIQASAKYVAPSGEKGSPHRYVPHNSKLEADIPACTNCHAEHPAEPLPAKGAIDLSKVGVQWCYKTCHHEKNLTSCKQCHP